MSHELNHTEAPAYTVVVQGVKVECVTVAQVVEAVKALSVIEREVSPTNQAEPRALAVSNVTPVSKAVYQLFKHEPAWRRPVEIMRALRRLGVPKTEATYNRVYAVLRYGDFERRDGKWNLVA